MDLGIAKVPMGMVFLYNPSNANQLVWPTYDTWSTTDSFDEHSYNDEAVRGLEVRIRCYEPASRAVIQLTVRESFN